MTILIIGGTGRSGSSLAKLLHDANHPVLIASRTGQPPSGTTYKAVKFDWFDTATQQNPFTVEGSEKAIEGVYIITPPGRVDAIPNVISFIDLARSKGVKRFVLLSGSSIKPDNATFGGARRSVSAFDALTGHAGVTLIDSGVDYAVLRPTWFIQNFGLNFVGSIKQHDNIFSATQDGRIPFVSTEDIAQAAFEALTAEKSPNKDIFVAGPELLSYDEIAKQLTSVLGREITHKRLSVEELANLYTQFGLNAEFANGLAGMEGDAAKGEEEALFRDAPDDQKFVGKHTLLEYLETNKDLWTK